MHFSLFHLDFLYIAVSWVLLRWHQLFSLFMDHNSGLTWALSIVMLVVTARVLLFRMFIKQVHFQRRMQEMAPKFNEIKKKYPNDRAAQQRETMELQRSEGFNPLAGCLPMFLQIPVFLGLYHVLRHLADSASAADRVGDQIGPGTIKQLTMYGFSRNETISGAKAKLFGAPLAGSFRDGAAQIDQARWRPDDHAVGRLAAAVDQRGRDVRDPVAVAGQSDRRPDGHEREPAEGLPVRLPARGAGVRSDLQLPARRAAVLVHVQHLDTGAAGLHHPVPSADDPDLDPARPRPQRRWSPPGRGSAQIGRARRRARRPGRLRTDRRTARPPSTSRAAVS